MLRITDLTYRIAGRTLIESASVSINDGMKFGLVGKNGTGKTTLFRLINGEASPESGDIVLRKGARIGGVAQEAPGGPDRLIDFVLAADTERNALMAEAETAEDPHRIADIHTRLADIDAHSADARAGSILSGLGFDRDAQLRPCSDFSGGWRMRVALAAVLFSAPDLLLLDEPTNYLDLEGTLWLETYLARYPHTVLLISHDRDLLNTAVDGIIHLDRGKLTTYRGGYDQYERQRREKMVLDEKMRQKAETQKKHMEAFVERFRYKASKARQAQSRLKMIARLAPIAALVDDSLRPFTFPDPAGRLAPPILTMEKVAVGYAPGKPVLKNLSLRIDDDDRIALLGPNGNGKSTFAKLISGRLNPLSGEITTANKLSVAYFAQHQLDELVPGQSAFDHVRALMPDATEPKVRARVARFGLPTDRMDTPAGDLSGGEKARLLLGLATFNGPNLLVLDEPTNHLDVDAREALVQALADYSGAVLIISHDRHLIEASADRLWLVADGTVKSYDGDLSDYRDDVLKKANGNDERRGGDTDEPVKETAQHRRKAAAARRAELAPLKRRIEQLERDIERFNETIERLDGQLADPDLFTREPAEGARLAKQRSGTADALAEAEDAWLSLSEDYEQAMNA